MMEEEKLQGKGARQRKVGQQRTGKQSNGVIFNMAVQGIGGSPGCARQQTNKQQRDKAQSVVERD